jgi:isopenicillin-N epimerase
VGNCHKWICAPKGAAFLHVREDRREAVRPLTISHGANTPRPGRSRFHDEFDWQGTDDPTPFLSVPVAIEFLQELVPGGWPEIRERNRELVLRARELLASALRVDPPCPDEMIGSLASLPLPDGSSDPPQSPLYVDPLQESLLREHGIEVPVVPWPAPPRRLLRVSAQLYNEIGQYERLVAALEATGTIRGSAPSGRPGE